MDLLNSKIMLECNEKAEIHNREIERFSELILKFPNYESTMLFKIRDLNNQQE